MSHSVSTQSQSGGHIRSLVMAMAGASVAAVGTMLVPVSILEGLAGSTGLSELVPAARAPLGDTARALIAFGSGALTLAGLSILLLRQDTINGAKAAPLSPQKPDEPSAVVGLLNALRPKMPWNKGDLDIRELADLPKLRQGDGHPDAPARRPLSASQDLPMLELSQPDVLPEPQSRHLEDVYAPAEAALAAPAIQPEQPDVKHVHAISTPNTPPRPASGEGSIAAMVAQLEAAVAQRHVKLAELEIVAAQIASERPLPRPEASIEGEAAVIPAFTTQVADSYLARRPVLEAVPSTPRRDDDVDSALAAALATLQRMNAGVR